MMDEIYLTPEGYEELKKELDYLKKVRRRELSQEIGKAREQGDISENAEYDAAKEAQGLNEKRIMELEDKLIKAQVVDKNNISADEVLLGVTVTLKDLNSKKEVKYTLLSELEADISRGIISVTSPVAQALLGHKQNDVVEAKIPAGTLKYKILKIER
ncbi:MAG: transcription elongation factor GreA [Candidatus Omnitrophica bacterium]|nr:transcription elongation factor GreA [Candidatus Omnitrophota bacterium]